MREADLVQTREDPVEGSSEWTPDMVRAASVNFV
jgi:hypothetical protein